MTARFIATVFVASLVIEGSTFAQMRLGALLAEYVDPVAGISLDQAIARALKEEPSLRAARSEIDVARGTQVQASIRRNPSMSFERREEPGGTDNLTTVGVEWPLDLFRRDSRVAAAERGVTAIQLSVADRERLLAGEVRMRYGEVLAAIRDSVILDELFAATGRQHELLRTRVAEGATPRLERDLLEVELRRLEAERLLQAGRTEAAMFELKRTVGLDPDAPLKMRDRLDDLVPREGADGGSPQGTLGVDRRADVRAAAARVDVADARIERVSTDARFDVTLFGNYMRMDAGFPQSGFAPDGGLERVRGLFHYISVGAMVTVPILNRNQGDLAAARAERVGAAAGLDAVRLAAQSEVAAARARDNRAQQAVKVYSSGAQGLASQNLSIVSQSYDLGRATVFEVLAEQRRYLDVERAYTATLKAAYDARTALQLAVGGVQ